MPEPCVSSTASDSTPTKSVRSWPLARRAVQRLVRVASFQTSKPTAATATAAIITTATKNHKSSSSTYVSRGDTHGWGMVLVLNELLDYTASDRRRRHLRSASASAITTTTDDWLSRPEDHHCHSDHSTRSRPHKRRRRVLCTNCQCTFSLAHDAASRPQQGFCSIDCQASHTYMNAIASDVDAKFTASLLSGSSSTLDCESPDDFSPATPISLADLASVAHSSSIHTPRQLHHQRMAEQNVLYAVCARP